MAGVAQPLRLVLLAAALSPSAGAQSAPVSLVAPATSPPAALPTAASPASEKLARLFAGTPPKYNPPKPETSAPVSGTTSATDQPRNNIVRLPTFIVHESYRLPDDDHLLTPQARQDAIVKRYVGEPSGLDVLLNKSTVNNTLWKKIPVLGTISSFGWNMRSGPVGERGQTYTSATPGAYSSSTSGDRIALDYAKLEAKRLYLEALGVSADDPPAKAKPKDENPSSSNDK